MMKSSLTRVILTGAASAAIAATPMAAASLASHPSTAPMTTFSAGAQAGPGGASACVPRVSRVGAGG